MSVALKFSALPVETAETLTCEGLKLCLPFVKF